MKFERLGNIIDIRKGKKPSFVDAPDKNSVRVLQIDDLRNDDNLKFTNDKTGVLANESDVLIAWDGANAGTIGYGKSGFIGSTIALLRKKQPELYSTSFLGVFLQSQYDYIRDRSTGATIPHISRKALEELRIPVIDIAQQNHIANLLSKVESLISQRKEGLAILDEFLKSTFTELFGNVTNNEKGFERVNFAKVALNENSKRIPVRQSDRDLREGIYPYYGATGIIDTIDDYKFDGDYLLIAEDGKNLLFRKKNNAFMATGRFWVNNHAHVLSFNGVCNLKYLEYFLNSIDFRPYITGIDQVKLNKENLDRIPVPVPPIQLQTRFAQIVEKTEALKTQYQQSLQELENLHGSLSQRAFKGELTRSKPVTQ